MMANPIPGTLRSTRRGLALVLALAVTASLAIGPAWAQEQQVSVATNAQNPPDTVFSGPRYAYETINLADAVRMTLEYDPRIQSEKQGVAFSLGVLRQAGGVFDTRLGIVPSFRYSRHQILPFFEGRETLRREFVSLLAEEFAVLSADLRDALDRFDEDGTVYIPRCPDGLDGVVIDLGGRKIDQREVERQSGVDPADAVGGLVLLGQQSFSQVCTPTNQLGMRPMDTLTVSSQINDILDLGLETIIPGTPEIARDTMTATKEIAEAVAAKAALSQRRLGEMPDDQVAQAAQLQFNFLKPFRNGIKLDLSGSLQSSQSNFFNKSLDPSFGGMGIQNGFPNSFSASLDVPLGKGRGKVSTGAREQAADRSVAASQDRLRHALSEEVFGTVLAYLNLVSSQDVLYYLEQSSALQQRLVAVSRELIQEGDLAQAEINLAEGREATVARAVLDQRVSVLEARFVLADAIGLSVDSPGQAPLAAEHFLDELEYAVAADTAQELATSQRWDLQAAGHLVDASGILTDAAQFDLKPRIDLFARGGVSTLYESPIFKTYTEELDEQPATTFTPFASPRGTWRSFDGTWQPFFAVGITIDLPFGNNHWHGNLQRERASLRSNIIKEADLGRVIESNVVSVMGALQWARQVVERRRESVALLEQTLQSTLVRFRSGDISLIDTLTTEEDLTTERIQLVIALQGYWSMVARLKFELGDIIDLVEENTPRESVQFDAAEFVGGR